VTDRDLYAAVDLGSNSFHLIVARFEQGQIQVIDRIRDMVRLAGGLDERGQLDPKVRESALASLARLGQRIASVPTGQVRAVGTQTFRRLANPNAFLVVAETALGCPIDIISGREEARLVYLGVSQGTAPADARRLVIDIGGGSTEIVLGESLEPIRAESLPFGCVGLTRSAFEGGRISESRWQSALQDIQRELQPYAADFRRDGWNQAVGSSGTIRAVSSIISGFNPGAHGLISRQDLGRLKDRIIDQGHIDRLDLDGLSESRRPVIAGGVLVLEAVMDALDMDEMQVSSFALREGLLHDLVGRLERRDPRERTVRAMARRYQIDSAQAARVSDWAGSALEQVAENWALEQLHTDLLHWTCQLHEIGLAIAHDRSPAHSDYILEHSDMPGFGRLEQQIMAAIAGQQNGRIDPNRIERLPSRLRRPTFRMLTLLRLATTMFRARSDAQSSDFALIAEGDRLELQLPPSWLARHPLTRRDLETERKQLKKFGMDFRVSPLQVGPVP
jgi:exopolyphosphatase / guanosine-5'-triphosphate,3'-diphosphate pyrophosphatase